MKRTNPSTEIMDTNHDDVGKDVIVSSGDIFSVEEDRIVSDDPSSGPDIPLYVKTKEIACSKPDVNAENAEKNEVICPPCEIRSPVPSVFHRRLSVPDYFPLYVKKIDPINGRLPTRGTAGSAGYDIYASKAAILAAGSFVSVDTGIAVQIPKGYCGRMAGRSSLALRYGIQVGAGVIDEDYRGELKVILISNCEEDFVVKVGDRIAQLVITAISNPPVVEVEKLDPSERGEDGFGSTGL